MKLNPAFLPTPTSPSTPRHQLDSQQNVFLSIRAPSSTPSSASSPPQRTASQLKSDSAVKTESLSPSLGSTPTRTSTPVSSNSSISSPLSPPSTTSPSHKRHHSLISAPPSSPPLAASNPAKAPPAKRVKGGPRGTKGLRYFSILVCRKLSECKCSTYNHIADVLTAESRKPSKPSSSNPSSTPLSPLTGATEADGGDEEHFDEKNIRRRIYDALNVLMAINFIVKDKKVIRWNGGILPTLSLAPPTASLSSASLSPPPPPTPTPHDRLVKLKAEHGELLARVNEKRALLTEQVLEYVGMRGLLERNAELEGGGGGEEDVRLYFPFILVNTSKTTTIDCEMSAGHDAVSMRYSDVFSVHDQSVVVRMLGKGRDLLWENIPKELQGLVVGLEDAKKASEDRAKAAKPSIDDRPTGDDTDDEDQPGSRSSKGEEDEGEDEEGESELEKGPLAMDDEPYHRLPHPSSLFHLSSSSSLSSSFPPLRSPSTHHFAVLQSPAHQSAAAAFLSTPMKPAFLTYPSPHLKGLSPMAPASPFHTSSFPGMFSPHGSSSHLPSPLRPLTSTPSPLTSLVRSGSGGGSRQPHSSSRLFGRGGGGPGEGVRRTGSGMSVVIGNSLILSSDASGLSSPQITVS